MWICPSCRQPLSNQQGVWRCASNHSFDQAKEGYVNLLLAQDRHSKQPGDSKDMVQARREFLNLQHYQPLLTLLGEQLRHCQPTDSLTLLDAGCGEGYYLDALRQTAQQHATSVTAMGCDIAKPAIQKAAKAYSDCHFAVASTFKLPVAAQSCELVLQVFAPASAEEIARVLKPGGIWLAVNPAADHLYELKRCVYATQTSHTLKSPDYPQFSTLERHRLRFEFSLETPQQRLNLLKMTPYFWHASELNKQSFMQHSEPCTADFDVLVLTKTEQADG